MLGSRKKHIFKNHSGDDDDDGWRWCKKWDLPGSWNRIGLSPKTSLKLEITSIMPYSLASKGLLPQSNA
jgi:hypothetical protein